MLSDNPPIDSSSVCDGGDSEVRPRLPIELAEHVLIHTLLLLGSWPVKWSGDRQRFYKHCKDIFCALPPSCVSSTLSRLVIVHLSSCALLPWIARPDCTVDDFSDLYDTQRTLHDEDFFLLALLSDRVDLLEWYFEDVDLSIPDLATLLEHPLCKYEHPVHVALWKGAWDALTWLAGLKTLASELFKDSLHSEDLASFVESHDERQIAFVAAWARAGYPTLESSLNPVYYAAWDGQYLSVLQALVEGDWDAFEDYSGFENSDWALEEVICKGHGQQDVEGWLSWLLDAGCPMLNVAEHASACGNIQVLEWWAENKQAIDLDLAAKGYLDLSEMDSESSADQVGSQSSSASADNDTLVKRGLCVDLASKYGHVHVLDWWNLHQDLLPRAYSVHALDWASERGHLNVLQWSVRPRVVLALAYTDRALTLATKNGHIHVLEWWVQESGLPLKLNHAGIVRTAMELDTQSANLMDWWINTSQVAVEWGQGTELIEECCDTKILERWFPFQPVISLPVNVAKTLCNAIKQRNLSVLEWWSRATDIPLNTDDHYAPMDVASETSRQTSDLCWLDCTLAAYTQRGIAVQYTHHSLDCLCWPTARWKQAEPTASLGVVKWWVKHKLEMKYSETAFVNAFLTVSLDEANWWLSVPTLPVRYTRHGVASAMKQWGPAVVVDFLEKHWLELNVTWEKTSSGRFQCMGLNGAGLRD